MKAPYKHVGCNYKLWKCHHGVPFPLHFSSLSLSHALCSGCHIQHSKLPASKVLANYQSSLLPCEIWSVWGDNMAIHYSLALGASCRSMGRTYQEPNSGYCCSRPACSLTRKIYWEAAGGWPSTDRPVPALCRRTGRGQFNDNQAVLRMAEVSFPYFFFSCLSLPVSCWWLVMRCYHSGFLWMKVHLLVISCTPTCVLPRQFSTAVSAP